MADLKKLLLGNGITPFTDLFNTTYANPGSGVSVSNFYNNWNWYSEYSNTAGGAPPYINGSEIILNSGHYAGRYVMVRLIRSIEGYSTNRPFKATFSYMHNVDGTGGGGDTYNNYSDVIVSIGGNSSLTGENTEPYGLAYHSKCCTNGNFIKVKNNGTVIGTPYTNNANAVRYYLHVYYDGATMKLTRNTSSSEVASYDFSYSVTDKTQLSSTLMIYCYAEGFGGDGYGGSVIFYDYDQILY